MKKIALYFLIGILLEGCSNLSMVKESIFLMDTYAEITCYDTDKRTCMKAIDAAFSEMQRIEKLLSKFDDSSEISELNKYAATQDIKVDEEIFGIIERSVYYSEISEGSFDITIGPLMELWGFVNKKGTVPTKDAIEETLEHVGYKKIAMDRENVSIHFLDRHLKIDLGGIAKGYAVDRAKDILMPYGIKNALINLGGNMFTLGNPPHKKAWSIGIQDPRNKNKILQKVLLKDRAISTSGDYERFFILEGKRYSHIINPLTGEPCEGIMSATVIADSAERADALSTAIFVMGAEKGITLAKDLGDIEVIIIREDGSINRYP